MLRFLRGKQNARHKIKRCRKGRAWLPAEASRSRDTGPQRSRPKPSTANMHEPARKPRDAGPIIRTPYTAYGARPDPQVIPVFSCAWRCRGWAEEYSLAAAPVGPCNAHYRVPPRPQWGRSIQVSPR